MSKLGAVCGAFVTLFALVTSCSGDEKRVARDSEAGAGGEAGAEGGSGGKASGGSSSGAAGAAGVSDGGIGGELASGGAAAGAGGALDAGGMGADSGAGGVPLVPSAGAGGGPDCPAVPNAQEYSCGLVVELWSPTYTTADRTIHLDVSQLPPIVSGTIRVSFEGVDGNDCQELPVQVSGGEVTAVLPTQPVPAALALDIFTFNLIDECGATHTYDPIGVACYTLSGAGGAGAWDLSCETRSFPCPGQCQ